jgi:hypothetical protein
MGSATAGSLARALDKHGWTAVDGPSELVDEPSAPEVPVHDGQVHRASLGSDFTPRAEIRDETKAAADRSSPHQLEHHSRSSMVPLQRSGRRSASLVMMAKATRARGNGSTADRIGRVEREQKETNRRLGRIEETLATSSRLFELMHQRLESLEVGQTALVEGQTALVAGQTALVEGQKQVIERLDRLVEATTRDRTALIERMALVEDRLDRVERQLSDA